MISQKLKLWCTMAAKYARWYTISKKRIKTYYFPKEGAYRMVYVYIVNNVNMKA
ncbi:unnamed protein product [Nezara viridula]|uniref:Uncharacterized protein n=1 Tax=Nezara viridula TaxID=85310 RepID=A0A9P0MVV1_NEZVI|nr:unnamed protein product [Nezara viridula]